MQLYIVRHGESANNALGTEDASYDEYMATRSPDPVLTQIGERQVALVGAHLAKAGYGITELHCSAMVRAMQTALPIGQALGLRPQVWIDIQFRHYFPLAVFTAVFCNIDNTVKHQHGWQG